MPTFKRKTTEENIQDCALPALEVVLADREGSDGIEAKRWHHLQLYEGYFAGLLAPAESTSVPNRKHLTSPIPKPGADDWLASNEEPGQSLADYIAKCRMLTKLSACPAQPIIALVALGAGLSEKLLQQLTVYISGYFCGMKVQVFHVDIDVAIESQKIRSRINEYTNQRQLWAKDCRVFAKDSVAELCAGSSGTADDICSVIAVTNEDLTSGEKDNNFLYGAGNASAFSGCFSLFRYSPSFNGEKVKSENEAEAVILRRACKILTHELTHIFGLKHCINYHCLMNGVNHVQELDRQRLMECPCCTKKLLHVCGWDLKQRYHTWLEAAKALDLIDLAQCIEAVVLPAIPEILRDDRPNP